MTIDRRSLDIIEAMKVKGADTAALLKEYLEVDARRNKDANRYFHSIYASYDQIIEEKGERKWLTPYQSLIKSGLSIDEIERKRLSAEQRVRRKKPHCLKTLRLVIRNGRHGRKDSICELAASSLKTPGESTGVTLRN